MDPVIIAKAAKMAADKLKDEENRKRLLMIIISILFLLIYLFSVAVYVVTNPIDAVFDNETVKISDNIQLSTASDTEKKIWDFLKSLGFSDAGVAGTMGNMQAESRLNPSANNNNHYYGICQWGGSRWQGNKISLMSFSALCGTAWNDLETQLNYFKTECSISYNAVFKQMQEATDVVYATDYFCVYYEVCPGTAGNWAESVINGQPYQGLADRRAYAQAYYEKYKI